MGLEVGGICGGATKHDSAPFGFVALHFLFGVVIGSFLGVLTK